MKSNEFKELKDLIVKKLENRHDTYALHNAHYVFHDNNMKYSDNTKHGISFVFGTTDVSINEFLLFDYSVEGDRKRFKNSKTLNSGFYHITHIQKSKLIEIIESKMIPYSYNPNGEIL